MGINSEIDIRCTIIVAQWIFLCIRSRFLQPFMCILKVTEDRYRILYLIFSYPIHVWCTAYTKCLLNLDVFKTPLCGNLKKKSQITKLMRHTSAPSFPASHLSFTASQTARLYYGTIHLVPSTAQNVQVEVIVFLSLLYLKMECIGSYVLRVRPLLISGNGRVTQMQSFQR